MQRLSITFPLFVLKYNGCVLAACVLLILLKSSTHDECHLAQLHGFIRCQQYMHGIITICVHSM